MKTGRIGALIIAFAIAILLIYGLRVYLLPIDNQVIEQTKPNVELSRDTAVALKTTSVPDFSAILDVQKKKQTFFDFLRPMVQQQNSLIAQQREFIVKVQDALNNKLTINQADVLRLNQLAKRYGIKGDLTDSNSINQLLARVDVIPDALVLVQAANETGWGSSRFAKEGLNFFGQWCFTKGCGLVPQSRTDGMQHEVAKFSSVEASVAAYLLNLNTNPAYRNLREIRTAIRAEGHNATAQELAQGLKHYSERKQAYVDDLLQMFEHNKQYLFPSAALPQG